VGAGDGVATAEAAMVEEVVATVGVAEDTAVEADNSISPCAVVS